MGSNEKCIWCDIVQDAGDRRQREQRERDEKEAEKCRGNAWFK